MAQRLTVNGTEYTIAPTGMLRVPFTGRSKRGKVVHFMVDASGYLMAIRDCDSKRETRQAYTEQDGQVVETRLVRV